MGTGRPTGRSRSTVMSAPTPPADETSTTTSTRLRSTSTWPFMRPSDGFPPNRHVLPHHHRATQPSSATAATRSASGQVRPRHGPLAATNPWLGARRGYVACKAKDGTAMAERHGASEELVSGADADGLVTMTVTADRGDVVDVALATNFRRVIASADLAGTVLRAFHAAQAAAIAWQLEHVDTAVPAAPEPAPDDVRNLVYTVLDQLEAAVERVDRVSAS